VTKSTLEEKHLKIDGMSILLIVSYSSLILNIFSISENHLYEIRVDRKTWVGNLNLSHLISVLFWLNNEQLGIYATTFYGFSTIRLNDEQLHIAGIGLRKGPCGLAL